MNRSIVRRVLPVMVAGTLVVSVGSVRADDWRDDLLMSGFADNVIRGESLRDQPVLLQFWESWCRSCGQLMSDLDEVAARFPTVPYLVVSTDEVMADARQRLASHPLFPQHPDRFFHDSGQTLAKRFDVTTVPTVLVVDAKGKERMRHIGHFNSSDIKRLVSVMAELGATSGDSKP